MRDDVRVRVDGWMPERLIQRAMEQGLRFSTVVRADAHVLIVETGAHDAQRLLELCERFSIPAKVLKRRGGSAIGRWLSARWTLLVGLAVAAALAGFFLTHIWRIDIGFTGDAAERGSSEALSRPLRELGIRPGMVRSVDTARLSDELMAMAEGYSFVGARLEGVRLLIEAAPEVPDPEVYAVDTARDLYADRTGIVISVNVEAGEACVAPGDTVLRGQRLIRGVEKSAAEASRDIGALGEVIIRTWFEGAAEGALTEAQVSYTGRQSVSARLHAPWFDIPMAQGEAFRQQSVMLEHIPIGGLYVPVSIERRIMRESRTVMERGDRELLSSRLVALALADARVALCESGPEDYRIARSWVRFTVPDPDTLRANAVYEIYTNAAVARQELPKGG